MKLASFLQLTRRSGNVWSYFESRCCSFPQSTTVARCTSLHIHSTLLAVVRRELNSHTENRTGSSLDADKSNIYFNFTTVCRMKQARSPQVRDEDCTPNLLKNINFVSYQIISLNEFQILTPIIFTCSNEFVRPHACSE